MGTNIEIRGCGDGCVQQGGDGEESEKVLGEMEDTGRKTGTCSVMKGKYTKSFYGGVVSVGSGRALTKESLPLGQVSPAASREVRNGEGHGSMTQR